MLQRRTEFGGLWRLIAMPMKPTAAKCHSRCPFWVIDMVPVWPQVRHSRAYKCVVVYAKRAISIRRHSPKCSGSAC